VSEQLLGKSNVVRFKCKLTLAPPLPKDVSNTNVYYNYSCRKMDLVSLAIPKRSSIEDGEISTEIDEEAKQTWLQHA
jgi:hypothetical protein